MARKIWENHLVEEGSMGNTTINGGAIVKIKIIQKLANDGSWPCWLPGNNWAKHFQYTDMYISYISNLSLLKLTQVSTSRFSRHRNNQRFPEILQIFQPRGSTFPKHVTYFSANWKALVTPQTEKNCKSKIMAQASCLIPGCKSWFSNVIWGCVKHVLKTVCRIPQICGMVRFNKNTQRYSKEMDLHLSRSCWISWWFPYRGKP